MLIEYLQGTNIQEDEDEDEDEVFAVVLVLRDSVLRAGRICGSDDWAG